MKKIGIIFAIAEEINALKDKINIDKIDTIFGLDFCLGKTEKMEYILVRCGVGKVNASRCTQLLIDKYEADSIINIGVAGGLTNNLNIGDIVVATKLVQHDFDITAFNHDKGYVPGVGVYTLVDKELYNLFLKVADDICKEKGISILSGVIASGDSFITSVEKANEIRDDFGASCIEMEGAAIAQVCNLCNVPFIVLRSISDSPNNDNKIDYEKFLESSANNISLVIKSFIDNYE